jgi:hypothetical protein
MPDLDGSRTSEFAASLPARLARALGDARGAMAGISASARGGAIDAETLRRLHEIYRLKVEVELETAAILWRTAEVVRALTDSIQLIERRGPGGESEDARWLGTLQLAEIEERRARLSRIDERRPSMPVEPPDARAA